MDQPWRHCPRCGEPRARPGYTSTLEISRIIPLQTTHFECQACFERFKVIDAASDFVWSLIGGVFLLVGLAGYFDLGVHIRGRDRVAVLLILWGQALAIGVYLGLRGRIAAKAPAVRQAGHERD